MLETGIFTPSNLKIQHWGTFDVCNYGDLIFPLILESEISKRISNIEITLYSPKGGKFKPEESRDIKQIIRLEEDGFFREILNYQGIILGGGDIIRFDDSAMVSVYGISQETAEQERSYQVFIEDLGKLSSWIPVIWNSVGIPFRFNEQQSLLLRKSLEKIAYISVRDDLSRQKLIDAGIDQEIYLVPDTAFLISRYYPKTNLTEIHRNLIQTNQFPGSGKVLCFQVNYDAMKYLPELVLAIKEIILICPEIEIVFLPIGLCHKDQVILQKLQAEIDKRTFLLCGDIDIKKIATVIAYSDYFAGTSLHGNITAYAYGIPNLLINFSDLEKIKGIAKIMGLEQNIINQASILKTSLHQLIQQQKREHRNLSEIIKKIDDHFDKIAEILETPSNLILPINETIQNIEEVSKSLKYYIKNIEVKSQNKAIEGLKLEVQEIKDQLERSQSHLQVELERSQSQIQQTQIRLERSQSQLQAELERSQSQLQQTQTELERSQSQLHAELERLQSKLKYTQRKLDYQKINLRIKLFNNPFLKLFTKILRIREISPNGYLVGNLESPNVQENNINNILQISGWIFSKKTKINSLILVREDLQEEQIEYGFTRTDVAKFYSDIENASSSGFTSNLIVTNPTSGYIGIQIWAILETGESICCFTRRVQFIQPNRNKKVNGKESKINLFLFIRGVVIKAITAYKQGRLPLAPKLWIYYLRRYYRQTQYLQNYHTTGIQYSGIIHPWQTQDPYQRWLQTNNLSSNLLNRMRDDAKTLAPHGVKISLIVPVYNTPRHLLIEMIDSVQNQIYPNWELCIADDASSKPHVREILQQITAEDARIKVVFRPKNGHIVEATNSALEIATGDYIALLDHDDTLSCDALLHVAECVNQHPEVDWMYTDEDKINESGYHFDPQMKGAWSPEMAITHNFTHHLTIIRKTLIDQVGGMRKGFEGAQDLDLFLRVSEKITPDKVQHIPHICYHWRTHSGSTASRGTQKKYVFDSAYNAIEEAIQRRGLRAKTFLPPIAQKHGLCLHQLKWDNSLIAENPVTIVIPTKDRIDLLKKCVASLEKTVDKRFVKLLIIDDCSVEPSTHQYFNKLQQEQILQCRVIRSERKVDTFNYAQLMNLACEHIDTPYMLHLNNDIQALEPGWLEDMVGWMSIDGVGVVGAKLLYPDNTIQHSGVVVGPHNGLADHLFHRLHQDEVGYICLPHATRNVSAVTGACLLTSTNLYRELGGFDEENFAVEYNDVDYCLRVVQSGKRIVCSPQAVLMHETSASRGRSYNPQEHINFIEKYKNFVDPFFSRSLDINSMFMAINPYHYSHVNRISKAKIIFITHNLNLEGAPLIVYNYAHYFTSKTGCEISVISSKDGILRKEYENLNIQIKIVQDILPLHQESLEEYHQRLQEVAKKINLESYDLVICNTLLSFWGIAMAKLFNMPTIWHIHESQDIDASIDNFFGQASREIMQKILPDCFLNASRVVFQAEATRRIFHQFDIKDNFRTISGGVDLPKINDFRSTHGKSQLRQKYSINPQHLVISIVGTTCLRKGQHIFIEAIKELEKICADKFLNISCLIVGARNTTYIDKNYLELLKRKIQELSLKNISIYFETKDVYDFYTLSDIFVCASFEESFPRVLLEAMAFELKIISTDVFGIPEIINDGSEGYLVEPGNPKALAAAIYHCIKEPAISERLAKNAYAKVCRMFDNNNLLQQHWSLAKEVILSQP
ncbi:glycosyltransferase [Nostoc parmelioides]|uniref:Glycosyltransferase n=1 Tax=Nostoc parmelioides FACHB-3921 TaxID=2692909 RepID=A0ABR8BBJ0_9NOSO|nr:glycosyltransferase [Nostoc parmelioides]MBD2251221.1 glycosyltransferase [Nostoc parmelioides FACHB-3921]